VKEKKKAETERKEGKTLRRNFPKAEYPSLAET